MAGRAGAALLAGEGHEHLVVAVGAADAGEALVQVAALEKGLHAALDDRAPEAVLGRKPLVVDLLEGLEMLVQQPPQVGGLGIAGAVQRQGLDTRGGHDRKGTGPGMVYAHTGTHVHFPSSRRRLPWPELPAGTPVTSRGRSSAGVGHGGKPVRPHGLAVRDVATGGTGDPYRRSPASRRPAVVRRRGRRQLL